MNTLLVIKYLYSMLKPLSTGIEHLSLFFKTISYLIRF